jgi:hypothetical protein
MDPGSAERAPTLPAGELSARKIRRWAWVLSCLSAAFSGLGLVQDAAAGDYPGWTRLVGTALMITAIVVMVCHGWRRRNPELVLVPLLLGMFASQAARTVFVPDDDRIPLVVTVISVVALVAALVGWWVARRQERDAR